MADLEFDRAKGVLTWDKKSLKWQAVSGPFGAGSLPAGLYEVSRREITDYTNKVSKPFRDKTNKGFFIPIYPKFQTNRGKNGGRLGIHPDGNTPGTEGCIGLTDSTTKTFHSAIASTAASAKLTLLVK